MDRVDLSRIRMSNATRALIDALTGEERADAVDALYRRTRVQAMTDPWFAARENLLTASDFAAVLGANPYSTRADVIAKKCVGSSFHGNLATRWGTRYESEACDVYMRATGLTIVGEALGLLVHGHTVDGKAVFGATPDFITSGYIIGEIKCPYRRKITTRIPAMYLPQIQFQLEVTGASLGHFVQYRPAVFANPGTLEITAVHRDRGWWERARPVLVDFWCEVLRHRSLGTHPVHAKRKSRGKVDAVCEILVVSD